MMSEAEEYLSKNSIAGGAGLRSQQSMYVYLPSSAAVSVPLETPVHSTMTITYYVRQSSSLVEEALLRGIRRFTGEATINKIKEAFGELAREEGRPLSVYLSELVDVLEDLSRRYGHYGGPYLDYEIDEETGEVMYFVAIFKDAGWNEWSEIEDHMHRMQKFTEGFLTALCLKAFRGQ